MHKKFKDELLGLLGGKTMLIRYIVSNYKSIGHPVEFSMLPTEKLTDEKYVKMILTKAGEWSVLRRGGFFGPNASGKTSFIESIYFARNFIIKGQKSGKGTGVNQYKGEIGDVRENSLFQFTFYLDGEIYEYGFSIGKNQVYQEWLSILTKDSFMPMFQRMTDNTGQTEIEIESRFAKKNSKERMLAEVLKDSIQDNQKNQLFLYKLYDNGLKKAEHIVEWFRSLQIIFPNSRAKNLSLKMNQDEDFREFVSDCLRRLDTGVAKVSVDSGELDFYDLAEKLNMPSELVSEIEEMKSGLVTFGGRFYIFGENGKKRKTYMMQLKFEHPLLGRNANFDMEDESDGTKRLLDLLPMLFAMDKKSQAIYFIDEIDRSLHTKLSQYLLREFLNRGKDTFSQIIFTAHDVNLINLDNFLQEEIWFVEKSNLGETKLKPFSDFDIEDGQNVLKSYLCGRFGAVPMIRGDI